MNYNVCTIFQKEHREGALVLIPKNALQADHLSRSRGGEAKAKRISANKGIKPMFIH